MIRDYLLSEPKNQAYFNAHEADPDSPPKSPTRICLPY